VSGQPASDPTETVGGGIQNYMNQQKKYVKSIFLSHSIKNNLIILKINYKSIINLILSDIKDLFSEIIVNPPTA